MENLQYLCEKLMYTQKKELNQDSFNATLNELRKLWKKYGYAEVLGTLSKIWKVEHAVPFFEKMNLKTNNCEMNVIASYYGNGYNGGVQRVNSQLMSCWDNMGYKVVFISNEAKNRLDYPYSNNIKRLVLPKQDDAVKRLSVLQEYILKENIDTLVYNEGATEGLLWECLLVKLLGARFVIYVHSNFATAFTNGLWMLYTPQIYKMCDMVIALSETNARFYQMCGCRTYLVQNPVPDELSNLKRDDISDLSSNHLLMAGRLSPEKRPLDVLKVFNIVHRKYPKAILDIAGVGQEDCIEEMKDYCIRNKLDKSVIFHGFLSIEKMMKLYHNASLLIQTSESEGYGMVLLEAKAYGLPIVMYELPYLALVKDGKGVLSSEIGDIDGMASHIMNLLSDLAYRKELGIESRENFEKINKYDLKEEWRRIFHLLEGNQNENLSNYFNPEQVLDMDKHILPMLFERLEIGFSNIANSYSLDKRIGKTILYIPRMIRDALKSISK